MGSSRPTGIAPVCTGKRPARSFTRSTDAAIARPLEHHNHFASLLGWNGSTGSIRTARPELARLEPGMRP